MGKKSTEYVLFLFRLSHFAFKVIHVKTIFTGEMKGVGAGVP